MEVWDVERGLPNSTVTGVVQAPDGYLWLSTVTGLARFDGVRFRCFVGPWSRGLKVGGFNEIAAAASGLIWARAENGELVVRSDSEFTTPKQGPSGEGVRALHTSTDGEVWATLVDGGIAQCLGGSPSGVAGNKPRLSTLPQSARYGGLVCSPVVLPDGRVWFVTRSGDLLEWSHGQCTGRRPPGGAGQQMLGVSKDGTGVVWVVGERALWRWHEGQWTPVALPGGASTPLQGVRAGAHAGVWIWSAHGIWRLARGEWVAARKTWADGDACFQPVMELVDGEGRAWFATAREGLLCVSASGQVTVLSDQKGLPSSTIRCLAQDHEGNVWVATIGGLVRIKRRQLAVVAWDDVQGEIKATGLAGTANGSLWIGSDGKGLWRFGEDENRLSARVAFAAPKFCRSLVVDEHERLWVGTVREGLWALENGQLCQVRGATLPMGEARSLLAGSGGRIWIGNSKGLYSWAGGKLTHHTAPAGLGTLDVRAMAMSQDGSLWVGTQGQGLLRWRDGTWDLVAGTRSTLLSIVWSLYEDREGDLWIGTGGAGLARWRGGHLDMFTRTNGLGADTIYSIIEDDDKRLWLGTYEGLFSLKKSEFYAVSSGRSSRIVPMVFTRGDGMPTLECSGGFQPTSHRTRDGRLWFSTTKGVVVVDSKREPPLGPPPAVRIEEVVVQGRSVPFDSTLSLGPLPRRIEIRVTALSFRAPERVRFRYKLEDQDKEWIDLGTDRSVVFDTLTHGEHKFHVTACNSDGIWSGVGATLVMTVVPIWWETWWFQGGILGGALFLSGITLRRITTRRLQQRLDLARRQEALERERARIAKDIHDDMGANLTEITLLSELAQSEDAPVAEMREDIRKIAARARELTRSVDATVWAVNPEKDTLDSMVSYICTYAEDFLESAGIRLRLDVLSQVPPSVVAPEVRHNLFLAVKEALHNAVKHATASEVRLEISLEGKDFKLAVQDNGVGFPGGCDGLVKDGHDPGPVRRGRRGNGLLNMRKRLHDIGGSCRMCDAPGGGAKIEFEVRLGAWPGCP